MFKLSDDFQENKRIKRWNLEIWADLFIKAIQQAKQPIPRVIRHFNTKLYE